MTYATQQDMVDRFGEREVIELTDRDNTGVIDVPLLVKFLQSADDEINGYLAARYTLPMTSAPLILTRLACDIARYQLCDIRATDLIKQRYDDAVKYLINVSKGVVSLGVDAGNQVEPVTGGTIKIVSNDRVFSNSTLSDY
ncbi:MAG TPA: DUF1320 domain-containing protein [Methylophilaceae bacterium]|nr:DUF1320 domain-containing protein [Methylophilaceae bacterium]